MISQDSEEQWNHDEVPDDLRVRSSSWSQVLGPLAPKKPLSRLQLAMMVSKLRGALGVLPNALAIASLSVNVQVQSATARQVANLAKKATISVRPRFAVVVIRQASVQCRTCHTKLGRSNEGLEKAPCHK